TRATLNEKANLNNLRAYFDSFQHQHPAIDITPYRRLCENAHLYMFYLGHAKTPQQQLPRYEFFHADDPFGNPLGVAQKILAAIQFTGLTVDNDHSFMSDREVSFLLPSVTQQAHRLSKDVGKQIDRDTGQWIMARYTKHLPDANGASP